MHCGSVGTRTNMIDPTPACRGLILVDKTVTNTNHPDLVAAALNRFQIEIPTWGFANTGTRFGKYLQAAAASTLEEKFSDAGDVHKLTGVTPTLALHVLWDLPNGIADAENVHGLERRYGVTSGSINPNLFQDQEFKF